MRDLLEEDAEVNSRDEPRPPSQEAHRAPKPPAVRYLVALAATAAGVLVTVALYESSVSDKPIYAPLLAAVALTSWYGGFGPSALVIVVGWSAALLVLAAPGEDIALSNTDDLVRWLINLLVALILAGVRQSSAASIAVRRRGLPPGSPPPLRAATVISRMTLVQEDARFASVMAFLRLICFHLLWPAMAELLASASLQC